MTSPRTYRRHIADLKRELHAVQGEAYRHSEMREHFEALSDAGTCELQFSNIQRNYWKNIAGELVRIKSENLRDKIYRNALERWELDKCIHADHTFNYPPEVVESED